MSQERRNFLKFSGLIGALSLVDAKAAFAAAQAKPLTPSRATPTGCVLIPTETDGPFPLDLSANIAFFRKDIRESKAGVPLHLKLRIKDAHTCKPLANARVNIWHCDKDGNYSGYYAESGQTYLRGYQITNAQGEVDFTTVFPGWYPGRTCHIHFQVYVSSAYRAISQLVFPDKAKNALYAAHAGLYARGGDPVNLEQDFLFSDDYALQLATLIADQANGGYAAELELSVDGKSAGRGHLENQNAKQFQLGSFRHDRIKREVVAPITLMNPSKVTLEWWSTEGERRALESYPRLGAGKHDLGLAWPWAYAGNLPPRQDPWQSTQVVQVVVENDEGEFKSFQVMPKPHEAILS